MDLGLFLELLEASEQLLDSLVNKAWKLVVAKIDLLQDEMLEGVKL